MSEGDAAPESGSDPDPSTSTDVDATSDHRWERIDWIACAALVVVSVILVGLHVRAYPTLSPIDEFQHVDYTLRAGEFEIVRRGDVSGHAAMAEAACRGVDAPGFQTPPCGLADYDPADFPELGINTAASQLPVYYVVTGVTSRIVAAIGVVDSQVTAARMTGALWLGGALAVIWYVMSLLGVARIRRVIISALVMVTPLVLFHAATINADAVLMLTGAVVLLGAVQFERGRLHLGWLLGICAAVVFVEPTSLLAVAAVGLYLPIRMIRQREESALRRFGSLAIIPIGALLRLEIVDRVQDAWFPRVGSMARAPMFRDRATVDVDVSFDRILDQLSATFTPVQRAYLPPMLRTSLVLAFIMLTNWLLIGLMFQTAFGPAVRARMAWWGRVVIVMLLTAGPFYTFYYAYFSNVDFPAPGRFALPLVPFVMVVAADALSTRVAIWVAGSVAAGSALVTVGHLLTA